LFTIARNLIYDHWRGKKVPCQSWEHLEGDNIDMGLPGPEDHSAAMELIHLTLAELPPNLRQCLMLRVIDGFSHHEIAEVVGISETSVGTYVSMARKQFCAIYRRLENEQEIEVRVSS